MPIMPKFKVILVLSLVMGVLGSASGALAQGMPERITIQTGDFLPSVLAYDPARGQFLVASAQGGSIYTVGADGALTPVISDDSLTSVRSLHVDAASDSLIVVDTSVAGLGGQGFGGGRFGNGNAPSGTPSADFTPGAFPTPDGTRQPGQGPDGAPAVNAENFDASTSVHVYSLATGEALRTVGLTDVAPEGAHLGGAAAVDSAGNIYVTDQLGGLIYMVDPTGGTYYLENATFSGGNSGAGLSGIAYDSASNSLFVTHNGDQALWRVPLSDPANPVAVTLPAEVANLRGVLADGAGNLLAMTGGQNQAALLVKLGSSDGWASATVSAQVELAEVGQNAALAGSDVYMLSGGVFGFFGRGNGAGAAPDTSATPSPIEIVRVASGL